MKLHHLAAGADVHVAVGLASGALLDLVRLAEHVPAARALPATIEAILAQGALAAVATQLQQVEIDAALAARLHAAGATLELEAAPLLAPFPRPRLLISSGGAYRDHLKEMSVEAPEAPAGFIKSVASISGPRDPIVLPANASEMVDWEGEFACVIGRRCHQVPIDAAMEYVAGYTLINDVSARDWVKPFLTLAGSPMQISRRAGMNHMGKQFPTFCPVGPAFVTRDELPDPSDVTLTTRVNGEVMQHAHTSDLVFSLARTVSHFSQWYEFFPGDIITTGSPAGVGYARTPQRFLRPGDVVEVSVPQIGSLRNVVAAPGTPRTARTEGA